MNKTYIFLTDGFEETEALTTVDIIRRADIFIETVSLTNNLSVKGKNGIVVVADILFSEINIDDADTLILPGGAVLPGYENHLELEQTLINFSEKDGLIAAICAAPVYIAKIGLLKEQTAVCFPALENVLIEHNVVLGNKIVEESNLFITSKGPGTTPFFALAIVARLVGTETAEKIKKEFLLDLI